MAGCGMPGSQSFRTVRHTHDADAPTEGCGPVAGQRRGQPRSSRWPRGEAEIPHGESGAHGTLIDLPRRGCQKVLTKALDVSVGDRAGGKAEKGFVCVVTSFSADAELKVAMEPGDIAFHDPPVDAEAGAVPDTAAGDHGFDAGRPDQTAVLPSNLDAREFVPPKIEHAGRSRTPRGSPGTARNGCIPLPGPARRRRCSPRIAAAASREPAPWRPGLSGLATPGEGADRVAARRVRASTAAVSRSSTTNRGAFFATAGWRRATYRARARSSTTGLAKGQPPRGREPRRRGSPGQGLRRGAASGSGSRRGRPTAHCGARPD